MKRIKSSIPIILLSGAGSVPEPLAHADAVLSKNEGPEQLLGEVNNYSGFVRNLKLRNSVNKLNPNRLLAAIIEDSDDAIFSKTLDGSILTWNQAAERMYGYRAEEVIGKNVSILLPPDRPNEVRDILKKLQHGEKIEHFQTTRRTKDGGILHVSLDGFTRAGCERQHHRGINHSARHYTDQASRRGAAQF